MLDQVALDIDLIARHLYGQASAIGALKRELADNHRLLEEVLALLQELAS